jgi:hypothetical protein
LQRATSPGGFTTCLLIQNPNPVAGIMTVRVIDALEEVDVEIEQA